MSNDKQTTTGANTSRRNLMKVTALTAATMSLLPKMWTIRRCRSKTATA